MGTYKEAFRKLVNDFEKENLLEYTFYDFSKKKFEKNAQSRICHFSLKDEGDYNRDSLLMVFTIGSNVGRIVIQSEGSSTTNPSSTYPQKVEALRLAKENNWKYIAVAISSEDFDNETIRDYVVSIESTSYGKATVCVIDDCIETLEQNDKPDFYRCRKKVGKDEYTLAFIKKEKLIDYISYFDDRVESELINEDFNTGSYAYEEIFEHSLYGMHIKLKNDALSNDNPHICIGWSGMGDLSGITTKDELSEKYDEIWPDVKPRKKGQDIGQVWRFIKEMQVGDYVVFSNGDTCHIGRVTSNYYFDNSPNENQDPDYLNIRDVEWLKKDVRKSDLSQALQNSLGAAMSVFGLNDYKSAIYALLNDTYVKDEVIDGDDVSEVVTEENNKKILPTLPKRIRKAFELNSILYGAPGTGKTYATAKYALAITEGKPLEEYKDVAREDIMSRYNQLVKDEQVVFTTFHQNYGYEDFIQGIRPDTSTQEMKFKTVDGVFKKIAEIAMDTPEKDFVIIIDEINRANISKVFGELITLIEDDKRWGEENAVSVTLPSGEIFAVPNNLYIVGTMNSADKSISLIDTALRRRFDFVEFVPDLTLILDSKLKDVLEKLNEGIEKELNSTDLLIGHSYFINKTIDDICNIMNRSIIPLLYEYFFDNKNKVEAQLKSALEGLNVETESNSMGRIKIKKKEE